MTEAESGRRRAVQVDRTLRALTIRVPCGECGEWTSMVLLYRCFQCGFWLCARCGAHHWPEAAARREAQADAMDAATQERLVMLRTP